jgi:amino acid transporter
MNTQLPYIILAIIVLLIVAALVFFVGKNKSNNRLTPLAGLAFGFILAGILFGENRILGYSLLGIGVILAVIDIIIKARQK